jgi:hypothetical protein
MKKINQLIKEHHLETRNEKEQFIIGNIINLNDNIINKIYLYIEKILGVDESITTSGVPGYKSKKSFKK